MYSVCDLRCAQVILQALQNKGFACYHIGSEQVRLGPLSDESSLSTSHCGQVCITRFTFRRRKARGTTRRQSVRSSATARSIGAFSCSVLTALAYRSGHTIDRRIRCILGFVYLPGLLWSGLEASGSMCAASLPEACRHSIIRRRVGWRMGGSAAAGGGRTTFGWYRSGDCATMGVDASRRPQVNSTLEKPKHISDTYLAMYIKQLQVDHYSVFVVQGKWPLAPIERQPKPQLTEAVRACTEGAASAPASAHASASFTAFSGGGHSLKETPPAEPLTFDANNDPELAAAIAASLVTNSAPLSADAMRQARLARFG